MPGRRDLSPEIRRTQRILLMVHELHKLGYQRLRIVPGMSPSGVHWRCSITHAGNVLQTHGAMAKQSDREMARYSSANGNAYFGWGDARQDTAQQLASKFLTRCSDIAEKGRGIDWPYVGWYVQMLGMAEKGIFPVAYADWYGTADVRWLPTTAGLESGLPMPPGGEAPP
jgi:hypothetical protein